MIDGNKQGKLADNSKQKKTKRAARHLRQQQKPRITTKKNKGTKNATPACPCLPAAFPKPHNKPTDSNVLHSRPRSPLALFTRALPCAPALLALLVPPPTPPAGAGAGAALSGKLSLALVPSVALTWRS